MKFSELWPSAEEVNAIIHAHVTPRAFCESYGAIGEVNPDWNALDASTGAYDWARWTCVSFPSFVRSISAEATVGKTLHGLCPLAILGDGVTTDHISPSGMITPEPEAGRFLSTQGVAPRDFNSFGTRRGCSDVVIRSTFANYRLQNEMLPGREGSWTRIEPDGPVTTIFQVILTYL